MIAGSVSLTVDVRSKRDKVRDQVVVNLTQSIDQVCVKRGVTCTVQRVHDAPSVVSDPSIVRGLKEAIKRTRQTMAGFLSTPSNTDCNEGGGMCGWVEPDADVPELVSGAGHDAMAVSEVFKQAMVFVRCKGGVSHSPLESITPEDLHVTTSTILNYLLTKTTSTTT